MLNQKLVSVSCYLLKLDFVQFRFYPLKKNKVDKIGGRLYMLFANFTKAILIKIANKNK